jgi:hypothetical protein
MTNAGIRSDEPHTQWPRVTPLVNFPPSTSVSKIVQHSRTDLLLAMNHPPELRRLDINTKAMRQDPRNNRAWQTLYKFGEGVKSCHGMTRLDLWRYAIITSEDEMNTLVKPYKVELTLRKGKCSIWIVDLKRWGTGNGWVEVRKLVDAPYAGCLRGITALPLRPPAIPFSSSNPRELGHLPHLLVSDATQGRIYILDANTGRGTIWFEHSSMEPRLAQSKPDFYQPSLGITALTCYRGTVYYLNTSAGTLHCLGTRSSNFSPWEAIPSTLLRFDLKHRSLFGTTELPPCTDFIVRGTFGPEVLLASPTAGIVRAHWHYRWAGRVGGRWYFHTMRRKLPSTSRSNITSIAIDERARNPWIIGYTKLWVGTASEPPCKKKKPLGGKVICVEGTFHGII